LIQERSFSLPRESASQRWIATIAESLVILLINAPSPRKKFKGKKDDESDDEKKEKKFFKKKEGKQKRFHKRKNGKA
jgi:hypothetical protein